MDPLILTFDIGTQSMRGMIINKTGDTLVSERIVYEQAYYSKNKDWAEQRPDYYYEVLCELSKRIKKKNTKLFEQVSAVTTTVFRDSTICLDENYQPLRDMILWLDKREIDEDEMPISKLRQLLFKILRCDDMVDMQRRQSICNYIMAREPDIWAKTKKYVVLSTYINYKLTGILIDSTANQIAHLPFDYRNGKWIEPGKLRRCIYDIPIDKLTDLCKPGEKIGGISNYCSKDSGIKVNTPVIATGSDKGCETIGLSVTSTNKAAVSFGTSATIQFATRDYFTPKAFLPSYPSPVNGLFNPEVQVYRGYWMLTWFKQNYVKDEEYELAKKQGVSIEEYFNSHLKDVPAGCDGLMMLPFWAPGVANPNAKGAFIGFSDVQSKYHIYRSIIEGINYEIMDGLYLLSRRGHQKIREIYIGGGGSKSDEICQLTADMLGLPVKRIQTPEASSLGASIIGFISLGVYKDAEEAVNKMVRASKTFVPSMANHDFYKSMYKNVYKKLRSKLEPYYIRGKAIRKGLM